MKTLSIETSSNLCSVAILEDKNLIKKIEIDNGLTHSETLMPVIEKIFQETGFNLTDIDLLVCDIGPGSFTGIRIGVATTKAFSDFTNIQSVGITSLEALAYNVTSNGYICSMIDCKNDNCYYALYKLENNKYTLLKQPCADSIHHCLDFLKFKCKDENVIFVGDSSFLHKDFIENYSNKFLISDNSLDSIDVYNLAIAGINKYIQKGSDLEVLPLYLKKPQAQRQLEEKALSIDYLKKEDLENLNFSNFDNFWNKNILEQELTSSNSTVFCAKLDNFIIGFVVIKTILDEIEIMNIAVEKNYRQQGIATSLLSHIIEFSKSNNIKVINLEVSEENFSAFSLYKKLGFEECGRRKKYYHNTYDAILMKFEIQ